MRSFFSFFFFSFSKISGLKKKASVFKEILCKYTYFPMSIVVFSIYGETPKIITRMFCKGTTFFPPTASKRAAVFSPRPRHKHLREQPVIPSTYCWQVINTTKERDILITPCIVKLWNRFFVECSRWQNLMWTTKVTREVQKRKTGINCKIC